MATVEYFIVGLAVDVDVVDVCGASISILLTPKHVGLYLLLLLYSDMTAGLA